VNYRNKKCCTLSDMKTSSFAKNEAAVLVKRIRRSTHCTMRKHRTIVLRLNDKRLAQEGCNLEEEPNGQSRIVRTELRIQEVAMLVHGNHSQVVGEVATAAGITLDTCHRILSDDLNICCCT
jgi:hypothetical protein